MWRFWSLQWRKKSIIDVHIPSSDELEEYNVNLHEEFHTLYNGVGPYAPPDVAAMDIDDED